MKTNDNLEKKPEVPIPSKPNLKGILNHRTFRNQVKGCTVQSLQESSQKINFPVNTIFTLGRLELNDLFIDSKHVSRQHATVEVREDRIVLIDNNSTNGTFIKGKRIMQHNLSHGEVFNLSGQYNFMISIDTDHNNGLPSLRTSASSHFIDLAHENQSLFAFFRAQFGEQVLLEVERQTTLSCSEFESVIKSKRKAPAQDALKSFLHYLSNTTPERESPSAAPISEQILIDIKKLVTHKNKYNLAYFEVPDLSDDTMLLSNGCLITLNEDPPILLRDIPYENILYMLYASHWLSQQEAMTE